MPKSTFYRLTQEKQNKILVAAQKEFMRVPYQEVSINKIIKDAEISRGSFYQYFEDKKDLFIYFLREHKKVIFTMLSEKLKENNGDLFACVAPVMDCFIDNALGDAVGTVKMLFSEPWIFQTIWEDVLYKKSPFEQDEPEKLIDSINKDLYDVRNEKEFIIFLNLFGMVIRDFMYNVLIRTPNITKEAASEELRIQMESLHRHYSKKK